MRRVEWLIQSSQIETDDCILWPYASNGKGYGVVSFEGKQQYVHRLVLKLYGPSPESDKHNEAAHKPVVCHSRSCFNLRHLYWATKQQNIDDVKKNGGWHRKLAQEDVDSIRSLYEKGLGTHRELADLYGLAHSTIGRIISRKKWA